MKLSEMIEQKLNTKVTKREETRTRFIVWLSDETREKLDKLHGVTGTGRIELASEILKIGIDEGFATAETKIGKITNRPTVERRNQ